MQKVFSKFLFLLCFAFSSVAIGEEHKLLWGDTHLHTSYSFDAFLTGNASNGPDSAYRFAKGEPVEHPEHKVRVQLNRPLDFLVIADHAEYLGSMRLVYERGIYQENPGLFERISNWYKSKKIRSAIDDGKGVALFRSILPKSSDPYSAAVKWKEVLRSRGAVLGGSVAYVRESWDDLTATADKYNSPGKFTALIGWEWSALPGGANLHRVVLSDIDGEKARSFLPFSSLDSTYPTELWSWMQETAKATGARFLSIPHNSNISKGVMFAERSLKNEPIDADYARLRKQSEPVVEISQIKGDSETLPEFSPNDEFADFETYDSYIQIGQEDYKPKVGDYIRPALKTGLAIKKRLQVNPFEFGVIGSTDSHTGLATAEENNFWGKFARASTPRTKQASTTRVGFTGWSMSAQGLAAVWATSNTREAIVDAFLRREVYATTGPRIKLSFFAGWDLAQRHVGNHDLARRNGGVPMGGVINRNGRRRDSPVFLVQALRDPLDAPLDRIQVVKGWLDGDSNTHEKVFDVVWAGARKPGADGKLAALDNNLNLKTGEYNSKVGAGRLQTSWIDPEFNPDQMAFYYVRVLQVATLRHSQLDATALNLERATSGAQFIQERAYSSSIWYNP